jgi:hypothetical protein
VCLRMGELIEEVEYDDWSAPLEAPDASLPAWCRAAFLLEGEYEELQAREPPQWPPLAACGHQPALARAGRRFLGVAGLGAEGSVLEWRGFASAQPPPGPASMRVPSVGLGWLGAAGAAACWLAQQRWQGCRIHVHVQSPHIRPGQGVLPAAQPVPACPAAPNNPPPFPPFPPGCPAAVQAPPRPTR